MRQLSARELFAKNLKKYRLEKKLSIYQIAKDTELTYSFVYELENMKIKKNPSMETMDLIADYFDIPVFKLFE